MTTITGLAGTITAPTSTHTITEGTRTITITGRMRMITDPMGQPGITTRRRTG